MFPLCYHSKARCGRSASVIVTLGRGRYAGFSMKLCPRHWTRHRDRMLAGGWTVALVRRRVAVVAA